MTPSSSVQFPELVCPVDHQPLAPQGNVIGCANRHLYAIDRGIPRVVDQRTQYAEAFGEQWNKYRVTQLDSYTNTTISKDRLRRCLGDRLWARLSDLDPLHVLEVGCGAGRFTEVLLGLKGAFVTSTDLSSAVFANQDNCPQSDRHRVIQSDLNALPFHRESYDIVLCLGVIQHTPSPEKSIEDLYAQVKPGGWLVIDHYAPDLVHYTKFASIILRPILKRLPPQMGTAATGALTKAFFPLHRAVKNRRALQMVLSRISPVVACYHSYPVLDDRLQYEWALLETNDHLTDYYKHLRSVSQIHAILSKLGGEEVWAVKGGNGVEARCRKPGK